MSWAEQTTSRTVERSIDGFWHLTRLFRVWGHTRESIIPNSGNIMHYDDPADIPAGEVNEGLPGIGIRGVTGTDGGSAFIIGAAGPEDVVWCYNAVTIPLDNPNFTDVEFRYTNDPRLIRKKVEDQLTFQSADMELPIGVKSTVALLGNPAVPYAWTLVSRSFPFTVGRMAIVVLLSQAETDMARYECLYQINAIHSIPMNLGFGDPTELAMRFEGADIVRYSPSYYTCRYSWYYDSGHSELNLTAFAGSPIAPDITLPQRNIPFFSDGSPTPGINITGLFIRPPYYRLDGVVKAGAGTAIPPTFYATRSSRYYGTGWTQLPGVVFP